MVFEIEVYWSTTESQAHELTDKPTDWSLYTFKKITFYVINAISPYGNAHPDKSLILSNGSEYVVPYSYAKLKKMIDATVRNQIFSEN